MLKNLLSVIAAVVTGWSLFILIQLVNYYIVPLPEGFEATKPGSMREFIGNMPHYGWFVLVLSYLVGSFAAGFVVGRLAESETKIFPVIISMFFMIGWISNIMFLPHPLWIVIMVLLIYTPTTLIGHRFGTSSRT